MHDALPSINGTRRRVLSATGPCSCIKKPTTSPGETHTWSALLDRVPLGEGVQSSSVVTGVGGTRIIDDDRPGSGEGSTDNVLAIQTPSIQTRPCQLLGLVEHEEPGPSTWRGCWQPKPWQPKPVEYLR